MGPMRSVFREARVEAASRPSPGPGIRAGFALLLALVLPNAAAAKSHLWDMLVVFSNAEGNVQFINMFVSDPAGTEEWLMGGMLLESDANTYVFPNHLPMTQSTFQTWVLIATQDYADLPGAPTPDYIIPPNFFDPAGDELRFRSFIDVFTIPPGAMPTDGTHALERDLSTPVNLGINFAGDSGTVVAGVPIPGLSRGAALLALGALAVSAAAWARRSARGQGAQRGSTR